MESYLHITYACVIGDLFITGRFLVMSVAQIYAARAKMRNRLSTLASETCQTPGS
jgi:hypothetical protein